MPLKVYDETINVLRTAVDKAKLGYGDKQKAIQQLSAMAWKFEETFQPKDFFEDALQKEKDLSHHYGGMTVLGKALPPKKNGPEQLKLF